MPKYARRQVDPEDVPEDDRPPQTGHTFNVWYLKWAGGDPSSRHTTKLPFRVNIAQDSGMTQGKEGRSPICVFFARGYCYRGKDCLFMHRLPKEGDYVPPTQDCFGREKLPESRDWMGGVGLLGKTNKTLFVVGFHVDDQVEDALYQQFGEFGSIDRIRVLNSKACAFVLFKHESEAQFAKEAMTGQSLNGTDVLTVKWANDDPNPNAQQLAKRNAENAALATVKSLLREEPKKKKPRGSAPPSKSEPEPAEAPSSSQPEGPSDDSANESSSSLIGASRTAALNKLQNHRPRTKPASSIMKVSSTPLEAFFAGYSSDEES